jgi:hypothetical protein
VELSAPPGPIGSSASLADAVTESLRKAAAGLADVDAEAVERAVRRPARRHRGGIIDAAVRRGPLDDRDRIRPAGAVSARLDVVEDHLRCSWRDGVLWMPHHVEPAMRTIVERCGVEPVTIGDLPALDASDRRVLVCRSPTRASSSAPTRRQMAAGAGN